MNIHGTAGKTRRINPRASTVGLSSFMKYRVSRPERRCPSALTIQRSHSARSSSGMAKARASRSRGAASEMTRFSGKAASIRETSVEPHRDMWKMNPDGARPGLSWYHSPSSAIGVRCVNRRLNGFDCSFFDGCDRRGTLCAGCRAGQGTRA
jgi:hypothetical protein